MTRFKLLVLAVTILISSCAPSSKKPPDLTPKIPKISEIPDDTPDNFPRRYYFAVDDKIEKEFNKLKTPEERVAFIENFWKERDTVKSTPENEEKIKYDEHIEGVKNEVLFTDPELDHFRFEHNDGYKGDAARVYLIHGPPVHKAMLTGNMFLTDLMLWVYPDSRGQVLYKFLFYRKEGMGHYVLFRHYYGSYWERLYELRKNFGISPSELEQMDDELIRKDIQRWFRWSLMEFSYLVQSPDQALGPPISAKAIFAASGSKILGAPPKLDPSREIIFSKRNAMIAGDIRVFSVNGNPQLFILTRYSELDWEVVKTKDENNADDKPRVKAVWKLFVVFLNMESREKFVYFGFPSLTLARERLNKPDEFSLFSLTTARSGEKIFKNEILNLSELPAGKYKAIVHLKSEFSNKDMTQEKEFVR